MINKILDPIKTKYHIFLFVFIQLPLYTKQPGLVSDMGCVTVLYTCACLLALLQLCGGSGYFELVIQDLLVLKPELASGSCCQGTRGPSGCMESCRPSVWLCLKAHSSQADTCMFGNASTPVLNSGDMAPSQDRGTSTTAPGDRTILLPFDFAWTVGGHHYTSYVTMT